MITFRCRALWLAIWSASLACAATAPRADSYAAAIERVLAHSESLIPTLTATAEAAADRLVAGRGYWITGSMAGFDIEGINRAGGPCLLKRVTPKTPPQPGDVILYGVLGTGLPTDAPLLRAWRQDGCYAVLFGSKGPLAAEADVFIDTGVFEHGLAVELTPQLKIAPTDGVANVINLWAFNAELVAALTRRGKMPTMYQSVMLPGSRERNARVRQTPFHTDLTPPAVPAGRLAAQYLAGLRGHVAHLRQPAQLAAIDRAAALAAEAGRAGGRRWAWMFGHYPPYVCGTPGDPGAWTAFPGKVTPETVTAALRPGDVFAHIGYTAVETAIFQAAKAAGAKTIAVVAPGPDGPPAGSEVPDVWIDPHWILGDAELTLDFYDVRILPPSGAIQIAIYWMLVAETQARL